MELESKFILDKVVAFDLETTGIDTEKDRIVQIGAVKFADGKVIEKNILLNPGIKIPKGASDVHGILDEHVKDALEFKQISKSLNSFFEGCSILGYNSDRFDVPLLVAEFKRCGIDFELDRNYIDVLSLERVLKPNNLESVYKRYTGLDMDGAHDAIADVKATLEIFNRQVNQYGLPESAKEIDELIQGEKKRVDLAGCIYLKDGEYYLGFGKHNGSTVKSQPSYVEWMLNGPFSRDTKMKLSAIIKS